MPMFFDIIFSVLIAALPLVLLVVKNRKNIKSIKKRDASAFAFIGIYGAFTYLVFRYFGNSYYPGSFFHVYIFVLAFLLPVALFRLARTSRAALRAINITMAAVLFAVVISRLFTWPLLRKTNVKAALPFNPCNLISLILLPAVLFNSQSLKNISCALGFVGGIFTLVFAFSDNGSIWDVLGMDSYLMHMLLTACPIFMILSGEVSLGFKPMLLSLRFFLPFYVFLVFFNQFIGTAFFFTVPAMDFLVPIYNFFPIIKTGIMQFNPLYYLLCLSGGMLACFGVIELFKLLTHTVLKNFALAPVETAETPSVLAEAANILAAAALDDCAEDLSLGETI